MMNVSTRWSLSDPYYEDVVSKVKTYLETDESITAEVAKMYVKQYEELVNAK